MIAEEYLERIEKIDKILPNKRRERQRWVDTASSMGGFSTAEKVKCSHDSQKNANAIITYCYIDEEIARLENEREAIIKTIERLPSDEYDVIYAVYVDLKPLKEVAILCDKSYAWVKQKKKTALSHIQEFLDAE